MTDSNDNLFAYSTLGTNGFAFRNKRSTDSSNFCVEMTLGSVDEKSGWAQEGSSYSYDTLANIEPLMYDSSSWVSHTPDDHS